MIDFFPLGIKITKQSSFSGCKVATYDTALQGLRIAPRTSNSAIFEIEGIILLTCQLNDKLDLRKEAAIWSTKPPMLDEAVSGKNVLNQTSQNL